MATYKHTTGKRFLFVHIPRTGGRFIEVNLEKNGWEVEPIDQYGIPHYQHSFIDDCEIAHFHRDLYEKYCDIEGIEQIAVVRNPIDKFFSASTYLITVYGKEIQEKLEDYDEMVSIIKNFPMSETLSWWRPQVDFVTDTTHIWKFEDGLGNDFGDWLGEKLGVPFQIDKYANYAMNRYEGSFKLDRTPKLIDNICKFWREDIEQFYPELATPL
tara:strand:+ start:118 stop:756 length:639 start_codon:yes stop_codon:yes gene_type:complete